MLLARDVVRILAYACKIHTKDAFRTACRTAHVQLHGGDPPRVTAINARYYSWIQEGANPNQESEKLLLQMLELTAPPHLSNVRELYHKYWEIEDLLETCRLDFEELRTCENVITDSMLAAWEGRHGGLLFVDPIRKLYVAGNKDTQLNERQKPKSVLDNMVGVYYLYRKHSSLPGLLREILIVDKRGYDYCRGQYHQFDLRRGTCVVPFDAFYSGFYILGVGARKYDDRPSVEVITIMIGVTQYTGINPLGKEENLFAGLLLGTFDFSDTFLAERILLREIRKTTELTAEDKVVRLTHEAEYLRFRDFVSNDLQAQVLTNDFGRMQEWLRAGA